MREPPAWHGRFRRVPGPEAVADALVAALRIGRNPRDFWRRRRDGRNTPVDAGLRIDGHRGFALLRVGHLPGQREAVDAARTGFDSLRRGGALDDLLARTNKRFLINVLRDGDFRDYPDVLRFAVSEALVTPIVEYLKTVPVLTTLRLWWTPPNQSAESSQLFHRDAEGRRQIKVFLNLSEVTASSGPLWVVPADASQAAMAALRYRRGKILDEDAQRLGLWDTGTCLTGSKGEGALVDTSRCLHLGSRRNEAERLVLMIQYTPTTLPRAASPSWLRTYSDLRQELDERQRLIVNARPDGRRPRGPTPACATPPAQDG